MLTFAPDQPNPSAAGNLMNEPAPITQTSENSLETMRTIYRHG